jgi:quercetin dioxygenase-like cupin family protein
MSKINKFSGNQSGFSSDDVQIHEYTKEFSGVTKQVPIGENEKSSNFIIRYFRLEPGTHSNLEQHPHEHGVIVMHGRARLQLNDTFNEVAPFDAIFISGGDLHQFVQTGDEPFGFLCVIKPKG